MSVPATSAQNPNVILRAIERAPSRGVARIMGDIDSHLKNNAGFMLRAIESNPPSIKFMGGPLKSNK